MKYKMRKPGRILPIVILFIVGLIIGVAVFAIFRTTSPSDPAPEIITVSTLEEIVNVNELSTYTAVYNGIAQVMNEKKPENVDYYVSYESEVKAGIDFKEIGISVDEEKMEVHVSVPKVYITDIKVEISSLEFIFINDKANTSTVSQTALIACEEDVRSESEQQAAILDLARQNAINSLTALIKPIIEQAASEYKLVVD